MSEGEVWWVMNRFAIKKILEMGREHYQGSFELELDLELRMKTKMGWVQVKLMGEWS